MIKAESSFSKFVSSNKLLSKEVVDKARSRRKDRDLQLMNEAQAKMIMNCRLLMPATAECVVHVGERKRRYGVLGPSIKSGER